MLSHEWRELETLCDRIATLRERHASARKSRNPGLTDSLRTEIELAQRQREALVQHISARLGSVAAEPLQQRLTNRGIRRTKGEKPDAGLSSDS
ncbi:MAG: hypothetical protein JO001_18510 [Alphaproteobacteria bacterium]|nr:hypothetical protein [Alphaproteobacteria bacterium]